MLALYFSSVNLSTFVELLPFVRLSVDGQPVDEALCLNCKYVLVIVKINPFNARTAFLQVCLVM